MIKISLVIGSPRWVDSSHKRNILSKQILGRSVNIFKLKQLCCLIIPITLSKINKSYKIWYRQRSANAHTLVFPGEWWADKFPAPKISKRILHCELLQICPNRLKFSTYILEHGHRHIENGCVYVCMCFTCNAMAPIINQICNKLNM